MNDDIAESFLVKVQGFFQIIVKPEKGFQCGWLCHECSLLVIGARASIKALILAAQ